MERKDKPLLMQLFKTMTHGDVSPDLIMLDKWQYLKFLWSARLCFDAEHPAKLHVEGETEAEFRGWFSCKEKGRLTRLLRTGRLKIIYGKGCEAEERADGQIQESLSEHQVVLPDGEARLH